MGFITVLLGLFIWLLFLLFKLFIVLFVIKLIIDFVFAVVRLLFF